MLPPDHERRAWLRAWRAWATAADLAPLAAVVHLAAALVAQRRAPEDLVTVLDRALLLTEVSPTDREVVPLPLPGPTVGPEVLGQAYEALLAGGERRARGAFFTPADVARRLVQLGLEAGDTTPGVVLDPAAGGGAFLLAAADALAARGVAAEDVLRRVHGIDVDPVAVAVADASLRWWAWGQGSRWPQQALALVVADALADVAAWPGGGVDLVVGNPPFLGQLSRHSVRDRPAAAALAARFGPAARGYVDTSALFLLAAVRAARPRGRVALLQPESVLVAAHTKALRAEVVDGADLVGVWLAGPRLFDAHVRVCAPVLVVGQAQGPTVRTWTERSGVEGPALPADQVVARPTWAAVAAAARGVPRGRATGIGRVGDEATATAGFRDQFYGLAPFVVEVAGVPSEEVGTDAWPWLITSGLVDPVVVRWGRTPTRFAGRDLATPVVDLAALEAADIRLGHWVRSRLVPKLVVAAQSSVLEAAVDEAGRWVPSVPCIAVAAPPGRLWHLAAVLNSPVATSWALEHFGGAGLSANAVKLSASQVLDVPLPPAGGDWDEAAAVLRAGTGDRASLLAAAAAMVRAYAVEDGEQLVRWWADRLPDHLS